MLQGKSKAKVDVFIRPADLAKKPRPTDKNKVFIEALQFIFADERRKISSAAFEAKIPTLAAASKFIDSAEKTLNRYRGLVPESGVKLAENDCIFTKQEAADFFLIKAGDYKADAKELEKQLAQLGKTDPKYYDLKIKFDTAQNGSLLCSTHSRTLRLQIQDAATKK